MLNAAATYGTGSEANFYTMPVAGKTGTSSDNWNRLVCGLYALLRRRCLDGLRPAGVHNIYGNPAAQVWKRVMQQMHAGLEYKSFPSPDWIGGDTKIFGDLTEEKEEQDNPSPTPEPEESEKPEETPVVSDSPVTTEVPVFTEPPTEPVEPETPVGPDNGQAG